MCKLVKGAVSTRTILPDVQTGKNSAQSVVTGPVNAQNFLKISFLWQSIPKGPFLVTLNCIQKAKTQGKGQVLKIPVYIWTKH